MYIYIYIFQIHFCYRLFQDTEYSSLCYSKSLLLIYFIYSSVSVMLIPYSHAPNLSLHLPFPFGSEKKVLVAQSCLTLCDHMGCSLQAPLSMEFCRQEYSSG